MVMSSPVEELEAAVTALDGLDLDGLDDLDDESLHAVTVGLQRAGERLRLAAGRCLARWDARQVWAADQSRSAAARLSREVNVSMRTARRELRRARRLGDVPATSAAVAEGRLSIDHVDLLARAQHAAPERFAADEEMLVGQCAGLRFTHAEQVVAYWRLHADPDGTKPADADRHELHASTLEDGTVVINGTLDVLGGEIFRNELDRLEHRQRLADQHNGVVRTVGERRAAALVEMATRSGAMPPGARRPRPLLIVHVGDDTARHLCQTASGRILHPATLTSCFDDADMDVVLFDGPTTVVSVSQRRSFTGAVRTAIQPTTATANTPPAATNPPPPATSTTSWRGPTAARPASGTAGSNAASTTVTPTATTPTPNHLNLARSPSSTRSAPACAGSTTNTNEHTPTQMTTQTRRPAELRRRD